MKITDTYLPSKSTKDVGTWNRALALHPSVAKDAESWVAWISVLSPGPDSSPLTCKGKDHLSSTWLFQKTWKKHALKSSQKWGEDNISNCFPGTGDQRQNSCSFWKCQRGKKSAEGVVIGRWHNRWFRTVIIFSWKHCSGSPGLTNCTNSKHHLKNRQVNYKITSDPASLFVSDKREHRRVSAQMLQLR